MIKNLDIDNFIEKNLKTEEDIKEWLTITLDDYIQDSDFESFFKALEYAVKAKTTISKISDSTKISRSNLYKMFKSEQSPQFETVMKVLKELGYTLKVA